MYIYFMINNKDYKQDGGWEESGLGTFLSGSLALLSPCVSLLARPHSSNILHSGMQSLALSLSLSIFPRLSIYFAFFPSASLSILPPSLSLANTNRFFRTKMVRVVVITPKLGEKAISLSLSLSLSLSRSLSRSLFFSFFLSLSKVGILLFFYMLLHLM